MRHCASASLRPPRRPVRCQRGAALLIALLTVTMIATFAATALWKQWRATEIEAAERSRLQAAWVLVGALDWARLILMEDALADRRVNSSTNPSSGADSTGNAKRAADHLGEPWAVPLEEVQLRNFLSAENNVAAEDLEGLPEAYLSGRIVDAQSKLNVRNLITGGMPTPQAVAAFQKLFGLLGLPHEQLTLMVQGLQGVWPANATQATQEAGGATNTTGTNTGNSDPQNANADSSTGASRTLLPTRLQDLVWLGLPSSTLQALQPHVTLLPRPTTVNINTASAEVLAASAASLDLANAQRLVSQRQRSHFGSLADANQLLSNSNSALNASLHGVTSQYFEVTGRLRLDRLWVREHSLILRNGSTLQVLWRERGAGQEETHF